jgi:DNA-binding LytR/AlgR family response regulator
MTVTTSAQLRVLAVDDEAPALDELVYLLRRDPRVNLVHSANESTEALRVLRDCEVDAVFLDIRMPGLDGMDLARLLRRFTNSPAVVFVTAYDDRAADAFDLGVVDYVRKPVRADRIAESLRRVLTVQAAADGSTGLTGGPAGGSAGASPEGEPVLERVDDPMIPIELGGVTKLLHRSTVHWVEAQGDYARLHTADGSHLLRIPLAVLADQWTDAGFLRIHRSYLVRLDLITELRTTGSGQVVNLNGVLLPVARRHSRQLRDRLIRDRKQHWN